MSTAYAVIYPRSSRGRRQLTAFMGDAVRANSRIMALQTTSAAAILRRMDRRLKTLNLTDNAASLEATGSRDTIRTIRRNVTAGSQQGISTETLRKLGAALRTTEMWLLREEGPESIDDVAPKPAVVPRRDRVVRVPLISWVSAGRLADAGTQIPEEDARPMYFAGLGSGDFFALKVRGDSMDRWSPDGSIIVINRADRELVNGKGYVFAIRGETTYKLWHAEPEYLDPYSTNPAHEPIIVRKRKDFSVVGRVRRSVLDL